MQAQLLILFFFLNYSLFSFFILFGIFTGSFLVLPPPPGAISAYANGIFPPTTPGAGSSWGLEDPMPGLTIDAPLRILNFPNTDDLLVLNKSGEVWQVCPLSLATCQQLTVRECCR